MRLAMPLLMGLLLDAVLSDPASVIPTKEQQTCLLKNVEEVFKEVKVMVSDEGGATDAAVIGDVQKMVDRALDYFSLLEESALIKLSCSTLENIISKDKSASSVQKMVQDGEECLQECIKQAADDIYNNSQMIMSSTRSAMNQGQVLLDTLNRCSRKAGLQQISCYKKVMTADVFPLKLTLLDAMEMHKSGHMEAIAIRNRANECVDHVLQTYQARVAQALSEALVS